MENNVYVVFDGLTKEAVAIDPSFEPEAVIDFVQNNDLTIQHILVTHAHFDHMIGIPELAKQIGFVGDVVIHDQDLDQWQAGGGAREYIGVDLAIALSVKSVKDGDKIDVGDSALQVRHTPGHSPGSLVYYSPALQIAFTGDLIFRHSVGRTDLDGGSFEQLLNSIQTQVFNLPDDTLLLPGHGPTTTIIEEKMHNPFI
jgi:glyoxylase-like metal-dependent hydrolase (beta-lactamase superfamily II)